VLLQLIVSPNVPPRRQYATTEAPNPSRDPQPMLSSSNYRSMITEQVAGWDLVHHCFHYEGIDDMSGTTDKIKGVANEAAGKVKQGVGEVVGSDKLKAEGAVQETKGDAQKAVGDAKNAIKDAANKTANAANKNL
jgi:uncharacterized protein YjbJ (UPF0337 family)